METYSRLLVSVTGIVLTLAGGALAEDPRPLREARSENGRFELRIDPGRRGERGSLHARSTLFEHKSEKTASRRVWRARLVNELAPEHAFPSDDGRFVVTADEFGRGGAAHAVVVYDDRGRPVREFGLRELLGGDDWKHVKVEHRAVKWLNGAEFAFVEKPPQFVIRLEWQREIRIDLEQPRIVGMQGAQGTQENAGQPLAETAGVIPPEILALLEAATSAPADQAAPSPGHGGTVDAEAVEALEQIADALGLSSESAGDAQTAGSEEPGGVAVAAGSTDVAVEGDQLAAGDDAGEPTTEPTDSTGIDGGVDETEASQPVFAGNSAEAGWAMPMPDPANPVDYVGLIMSYTETDGPSAVPLYQAAFEQCHEFDGDWDLVDAAMRGDPEALALPEIAAYLELHRDALATFHAAPQYEYRGMIDPGAGRMVVDIILPSLSKARHLAKLSVLQAKYMEANGDAGGAVDNYLSTLAAGAQLSDGPTLIENLVGIAIQDLTAYSLLDSLAAQGEDALDYQHLAQQLEGEYRPVRPMVEAFQGERACGLDMIQRVYEWNDDTRQYRVSDGGFELLSQLFADDVGTDVQPQNMAAMRSSLETLGFRGMVSEANQLYDRLTETASMPYQQGRQAWDDLDSYVGSPEFKQRNPLMSLLMPSLGRASHLSTRAITTRNATRLVANLKAYRQQNGSYPESLDVFGDSEMTRDPFTGDRFVYRVDGGDFTLYSLGGNGVDDGGVNDRRADTNDVRYWPRPPRKD